MNSIKFLFFCSSLLLIGCQNRPLSTDPPAPKPESTSKEILVSNLMDLAKKGYMIGHQDALAYGVSWRYQEGRSDIQDVAGDYPALYGWDIGGIEHGKKNNIDGVPFSKMIQWIKEIHQRKGLSTISWHMDNPLSGGNSWDVTAGTVESMLPGGSKNTLYNQWLDRAADFLNALEDTQGNKIPVLFRPYHELTGTWFWWCQNNTSSDNYKALWRYTFDYLTKNHQIKHLVWVYNTADYATKQEFLEYYPSDALVDMLSFDKYQYGAPDQGQSFKTTLRNQLQILTEIGKEKNKPIAFAETGYETIPDPQWWTGTLHQILKDFPVSHVLLWRNHGWQETEQKMHYYAPHEGHPSAKDFQTFHALDATLFQSDLSRINIYQ